MAGAAHHSTAEKVGIGVALAAHAGLIGVLWWMAKQPYDLPPPPDRIDVSLAAEISLESTAPNPDAQPAASFAPVISEMPQPPAEPDAAPPEPVEAASEPPPRVTPTGRSAPRPPLSAPPSAPPSVTPSVTPSASPSPRPAATPNSSRSSPRPSATSSPRPSPRPSQRAGGSRLSDDFLDNSGSNAASSDSGQPAATFGAAERASLVSAIARQLRPNWSAPRGQDWELLVSRVSWSLNRDGTVRGTPRCSQVGRVTDSNRPQVAVHCEAAMRAVRTTRFNLPEQFYTHWDDLEFDFDRRL